MSKVIVIGGGAAGMMAAIRAGKNGHEVHLLEQNEKLGKKIFITGKGRCNITNACDMDILFQNVVTNPKFLYSAFYGFSNEDTIRFFEDAGLSVKIERGNRVFPTSDHSYDVIGALTKELKKYRVSICLHTKVDALIEKDGICTGVRLDNGKEVLGDAVIVCTGGFSYQTTGSTGDGYTFAKSVGHEVTDLIPSLVPFEVQESFAKDLQGLSLKNVRASICDGKKVLYSDLGEMLFTHYGVSGPLILSGSSVVGKMIQSKELTLAIDLKPALSVEQLDKRILRDFEENKNKQFKNAVTKLFPGKLIPVMIKVSGIDENKQVNEISKEERLYFVNQIKQFKMTLTQLRDFNEAIITKGGVTVKEIDPGTMESKRIKGLFFAGEVLDLDALTGGFNLQIAWSTGYLAGNSI